MKLDNFAWDQDEDGIVTLTWDMPGKPVNLLSMSAVADLGKVAEALAATDDWSALVQPCLVEVEDPGGRFRPLRMTIALNWLTANDTPYLFASGVSS